MQCDMPFLLASHWHSLGSGVLHQSMDLSIQNQEATLRYDLKSLDDSCFGSVKTTFADGGCDCIGSFLLSQLFFEFRKLFHGDLFFLVEHLIHTLDLFNL